MNSLVVNQSICRNDGACVKACPISLLELAGTHKGPSVIEAQRENCVQCGHCVSVCPMRALEWTETPKRCVTRVDEVPAPTATQVNHWLKARRSIRVYKQQLVPKDLLEQVLDVARYAPSGHNRQPVAWVVVSGRNRISALSSAVIGWMRTAVDAGQPAAARLGFEGLVRRWDAGEDQICRNAPHLFLACGPVADSTAPGACTIAVTYLQLAATGQGLGTCWAGYVMIAMSLKPSLRKLLDLPEGHQVYAASMLGYPQYDYCGIPERNELKVTWQ